jgi:L-fucose isomerase-like protein
MQLAIPERGAEALRLELPTDAKGGNRLAFPVNIQDQEPSMTKVTLGVIFGNRDFFPDKLVTEARAEVKKVFKAEGINALMLGEKDTKLGGVETHADARRCAELFSANRGRLDGMLVCLPNFGDEKAVADVLKMSRLDLPVLIQAYPDELDKLNVEQRRDGFCGKISVCNNLAQAGIPFTLTTRHVVRPADESFRKDLADFVAVCRVVKGLRGARLGAIGARPAAFNTVRYSEKILEANGIAVTTVDWSELLGAAQRLDAKDRRVSAKLREIRSYISPGRTPEDKLARMARLGVVIDDWVAANELNATALQCWTSIQANYGINVCALMSMMSHKLMPSACEVDVTGVLSMYALQLASQTPSALVDWNNNYGRETDKCVLFHCGNWARCYLDGGEMATAPILGTSVGEENTYGALAGRTPAGPMTYARLTTDDTGGCIRGYVGQGMLTNDRLNTFGARAVAEIGDLEGLMAFVCANGFEHHTAINLSHCAGVITEALGTYLGWQMYRHDGPAGSGRQMR